MELSFSTPEIREICERRSEATAKLGYDAAIELARVLADVEACGNFAEFQAMFGRQISDLGTSEKCLRMKAGNSVRFQSGHPRNLGAASVATDWPTTTRLKIVAIEAADA